MGRVGCRRRRTIADRIGPFARYLPPTVSNAKTPPKPPVGSFGGVTDGWGESSSTPRAGIHLPTPSVSLTVHCAGRPSGVISGPRSRTRMNALTYWRPCRPTRMSSSPVPTGRSDSYPEWSTGGARGDGPRVARRAHLLGLVRRLPGTQRAGWPRAHLFTHRSARTVAWRAAATLVRAPRARIALALLVAPVRGGTDQ